MEIPDSSGCEMLESATSVCAWKDGLFGVRPSSNYSGGGIPNPDLTAQCASPVHTPRVTSLLSDTLPNFGERSEADLLSCTPITIVARNGEDNTNN